MMLIDMISRKTPCDKNDCCETGGPGGHPKEVCLPEIVQGQVDYGRMFDVDLFGKWGLSVMVLGERGVVGGVVRTRMRGHDLWGARRMEGKDKSGGDGEGGLDTFGGTTPEEWEAVFRGEARSDTLWAVTGNSSGAAFPI
jgi:hypothetical protein